MRTPAAGARAFALALAAALLLAACGQKSAPRMGGGTSPRAAGPAAPPSIRFEAVRRYPAGEARQAVAVDAEHFYAIDDRAIGKYRLDTGAAVTAWVGEAGGPIVHLNSGVVVDGLLYAAHSNYPAVPMRSSIEVFDPETLAPVGRRDFGASDGSATWVDRHADAWWVTFAHYAGRGGAPGKGPADTRLVVYDDDWRPLAEFRYPAAVVERFGTKSCSGGSFGPDGLLYVSGHDAAELYALRVPEVFGAGGEVALVAIVPVEAEGQGIAWGPHQPHALYTILRSQRAVVASRPSPVE